MTSELSPDGTPVPPEPAAEVEPVEEAAVVAVGEPAIVEGEPAIAEDAPRISPSVPERPWARRTFIVRALAGIGAALAAVVAIPVAGLAAAPATRTPLRFPFLSGSVPPTPRATGFTNLGPLSNYPVGVPTLVPVTVSVEIGGATQDAQVAVYVIRPHDQSVLIVDIHCTHMGCPVGWSAGAKRFLCPCHGGAFTADGHQVAGPPPRPLDRYQALIANQEVWMGPLIEGA
jgi:menaquinol-cytochrome c reductase iron-sulfur subunit